MPLYLAATLCLEVSYTLFSSSGYVCAYMSVCVGEFRTIFMWVMRIFEQNKHLPNEKVMSFVS